MNGSATRIEKDAMGEVRVDAAHLWGAQTQRSVDNFPIGVGRFSWGRPVVRAFGIVKQAAARANVELGELPPDKADLIVRAAQEVIDGRWDNEFPLVVFQTGSGTQSNMNANEVIANRAIQLAGGVVGSKKPIHPNDDVNRSQSSNDVFPAVMHIATVEELDRALLPAVAGLRATLDAKAREFADIVMLGRTHLQDATPVTLGQVISGWVAQLDDGLRYVRDAREGLFPLALGGTAVGTGINAPAAFGEAVARQIATATGKAFRSGAEQVRGAVGPRCDGQRQRGAAHAGRRADEDRQRRALVRERAARRIRRDSRSPTTSRGRRSCRARSIRRSARR